jgi:hypothetical protein
MRYVAMTGNQRNQVTRVHVSLALHVRHGTGWPWYRVPHRRNRSMITNTTTMQRRRVSGRRWRWLVGLGFVLAVGGAPRQTRQRHRHRRPPRRSPPAHQRPRAMPRVGRC